MRSKERYEGVIGWFSDNVPVAETELHYDNPFHLLIAVILSAQCTDKRVNMITPPLFKNFPTPEVMANSPVEEVFEYIKSVSYPNNKAKNLVGMAKKLISDFGGEVPTTIEELITIPKVGRKTANVMLAVAFDKPAMPVDTHVSGFRTESDSQTTPKHLKKQKKFSPSIFQPKFYRRLIIGSFCMEDMFALLAVRNVNSAE